MKRIILRESQYKRLVKQRLNEQKIVFKDSKDEYDVTNEMMQLLIHLKFYIDTIANKDLYIDKVENGIVYIDPTKYTKEEKDLINKTIDEWISFSNINTDKRTEDLTYNFGTDTDWDDLHPMDDIAVVDNTDNSTTNDIDLEDNSTAEIEEEVYDVSDIKACKWGTNSKGVARTVVLPSDADLQFYKDVITGVGGKPTCEKMLFFFAWADAEDSDSSFNPFATTHKDTNNECCYANCLKGGVGYKPTGCRTCPEGTSPGVRNYKTKSAGKNATINTIKARYYPNILSKLKNDNTTAMDLANETSELAVWGTGSLPKQVLMYNKKIDPKAITQYDGKCGVVVEVNCELTVKQLDYYNENIKNNEDNLNFRDWVNKDSSRLEKVNKRLTECGLPDPKLDKVGTMNQHLKVAFTLLGKDWVNAGKPVRVETETEVTVKNNNGNLPFNELTKVQNDVNGNEEYLSTAAATAFNQMVLDAAKEGVTIKLTDAYRRCGSPGDYGRNQWSQWYAWEDYKFHGGNEAASPVPSDGTKWTEQGGGYCTSNHGWGNAIDVSGREAKKWIKKHGEKYGWYWGEAPSESWHFTFCGSGVKNEPNYCKKKSKSSETVEAPKSSEVAVGSGTYIVGKNTKIDKNGPANHASRALGNWQSDNATDIFGGAGSTVYSITKGTVSKVSGNQNDHDGKIYGASITVKGDSGYPDIFYTHLQNVKVVKGQTVTLGTPLAEISLWNTSPKSSHVHVGLPYGNNLNSLLNMDTGEILKK